MFPLILVYRNLLTGFTPVLIAWNIIFPLITIYVGGNSYEALVQGGEVMLSNISIPYIVFLTSGIIGYNVLWTCIVSGTLIWNDKSSGMFDQIMGMPFTRFQYVFSQILTIVVMGLISAAAIFIIGLPTLIGYVNITFSSLFYLLFALISCSIFFGSLVIVVSLSMRSIEALSFNLEAGFIIGLFFFLLLASSVYYPMESIFEPLRTIIGLNPLTHIVDLIRDGVFNQVRPNTNLDVLILSLITALSVFAATVSLRIHHQVLE